MMRTLLTLVGIGLALSPAFAAEPDGTLELADRPAPDAQTYDANPQFLPFAKIVLNPIDSVSMTSEQVWRDNRHRAYQNAPQGVTDLTGFLLFDVTAIPDGSFVVEMRLRCYLENAFGSPFASPLVDIHSSPDDQWTRGTVEGGAIALGDLLKDDAQFQSFVPSHEFVLRPSAHDWEVDLADDRITIGFRADVSSYGYVYFFGAGGNPVGPPPELTIQYQAPTSIAATGWAGVKTLYR